MNVERGLRRLLVVVTVALAIVVVALRLALSQAPVSCTYMVILADGIIAGISAPVGVTIQQVQIAARRLHPETKNPVVFEPLTGDLKKDLIPSPPDSPATPEMCAVNEGTFARLARYAYEGAVGVALALMFSAVLWAIFFTLRWVARGFKSAT